MSYIHTPTGKTCRIVATDGDRAFCDFGEANSPFTWVIRTELKESKDSGPNSTMTVTRTELRNLIAHVWKEAKGSHALSDVDRMVDLVLSHETIALGVSQAVINQARHEAYAAGYRDAKGNQK